MAERVPELPPDAMREALRNVLASPDFRATDRLCQFLSYVVEETLAGRADRIKAYTIATLVFGRNESFDAQTDSIVRIEAGRLRRALNNYYLTGGRDERIQIRIPLGSYVPMFVGRDSIEPSPTTTHPATPEARFDSNPSVLVEPFEQEGASDTHPHFAAGLTHSLVVRLTRFSDLRVFYTGSALEADPVGQTVASRPDYVLRGTVTVSAHRLGVEIVLLRAQTGRTVWADSFESTLVPTDFFSAKDEIANRVARIIAQPYGMIFTDKAKDSDGEPPAKLSSYSCVLYFYRYWKTFDRDMIGPARDCLERTIRADPNYAEAFACLSLIYSNAHRYIHLGQSVGFDPRERALELANRAVELAPNSSWSHYARSLAYWLINDVAASIQALETGRQLNPNDAAILAELGQRYAFRMQWDKAVPLLETAFELNPAHPGWYRVGVYLYHLAHGRFEEALQEARRIQAPSILYGHIAIAIAAAELGRTEEAAEAVRRILDIDPSYGDHVASELKSRNLHDGLIAITIEGLRKAGMPGRDVHKFPPQSRQA